MKSDEKNESKPFQMSRISGVFTLRRILEPYTNFICVRTMFLYKGRARINLVLIRYLWRTKKLRVV